MLIVGAKGFAIEVLEILYQLNECESIAFFDNVSDDIDKQLFNQFSVLRSFNEVSNYFNEQDYSFTLGLGNPFLRYEMCKMFESLGGKLTSTISPFSNIGHFDNNMEVGQNIMTGAVITNCISIKKGCLINVNCTIGHNSNIGQFVEMNPGVHISGGCTIGDFCNIGTNASVLPNITLGNNVVVGAGAVVTQNIEDNTLVVGVPARTIKKLKSIDI